MVATVGPEIFECLMEPRHTHEARMGGDPRGKANVA